MFEQLLQDLRYAARVLWRAKAFTATAVLCLGLGIGANTAIFGVVRAVLLRPLDFPDPDRLTLVWELDAHGRDNAVAMLNYEDLEEQQQVFSALGAVRPRSFNLSGVDQPIRVQGGQLTSGVLEALAMPPELGRIFTKDDDHPGAEPVAILSHGLYERLFAGDPEVLGRDVVLDGRAHEIIGVVPAGFSIANTAPELYVPLGLFRDSFPNFNMRGSHPSIRVVARRAPGVSPQQAQADLDAIAGRLAVAYPDTNKGRTFQAKGMHEQMVEGSRAGFVVLSITVGLVLLIASVNVANLLLARANARQQEIAVRRALGASAWRIVRQLLTESVVLAAVGGLVGTLIGAWGLELLLEYLPQAPLLDRARIDGPVLGFTAGISLATALVFGSAPAWLASRSSMYGAIKGGAGGWGRRGRNRLQAWLVGTEAALAFTLLVGAGLSLNSLQRLAAVDVGFETEGVLTFATRLPKEGYPEASDWTRFYGETLRSIEALPGVESAAASTMVPMADYTNTSLVTSEDSPIADPTQWPSALHFTVSGGYFETLGIPLRAGRVFDEHDRAGGQPVAVISESCAETLWPGGDAVGRRMRFGWAKPVTVIGVVGDVKHADLAEPTMMQLYSPLEPAMQGLSEFGMPLRLAVKTDQDPSAIGTAVRAEVARLDPNLPLYAMRTMPELVGRKLAGERTSTVLLGVFAAIAVVLAAIGIYGVMTYTVVQRTREIGIRMALGATAAGVRRLVLRQAARIVGLGLAAGIVLAAGLSRFIGSELYGVNPLDPPTYVATAVGLMAVALLASYLPARRATAIDPMGALRSE